jgi:hypothetical protein
LLARPELEARNNGYRSSLLPYTTAKGDEEVLDKVQGYLAALLHNGQIVGDHTPMAKVSGDLLVTASPA